MQPAATAASHSPVDQEARLWTNLDPTTVAIRPRGGVSEAPRRSRHRLDRTRFEMLLAGAPREGTGEAQGVEVTLPLPDGQLRRFVVKESPVMEEGLAHKFPRIRTYAGHALEGSGQRVRLNLTPHGLHASLVGFGPQVFVDPSETGPDEHVSYYREGAAKTDDGFECLTQTEYGDALPSTSSTTPGTGLRTARLALAATGEYTQYHGGTKDGALNAIVTAVNRLNSIYESELALRFILVADNDLILFTDATTDPYSGSDASAMLGQNQATLDTLIGNANYDVGHVFSTGGGGLAQVGGACAAGWKAQGVTGRPSPMGDPFYVDYVAHELGHQFGAHHTFNGVLGGCTANNRHAGTAYEPGSGSTIMAYAGICAADNVQSASDAYFHSASLVEIQSFLAACALPTQSPVNQVPTVEAGVDRVIPHGTPFVLTGLAWDADGDPLSHCWEQCDLGPAALLTAPDSGSGPLFRSRPPQSSPERWFPERGALLSGGTVGETLPETGRFLNFRVTARDGQSAGMDSMQITVAATVGPFRVNAPAEGTVCSISCTVAWDVAGTDQAPVSAGAVDILLSTNGGWDFPIVLASHTPNDGVESVNLPDIYSEEARVLVRASENIFFSVSPSDFVVHPHAGPPQFAVVDVEVTNPGGLLIPAANTAGNASVYPSQITMDEPDGVIEDVAVELHGLSHGYTPDLDVLLVPPVGDPIILLSDVGSTITLADADLVISDAGQAIPADGLPGSGHFLPSNVGTTGDAFPVAGPYALTFSELKGRSPSGTWSLYVRDDAKDDTGVMAGGWSLKLRIRRLVEPNQPPQLITESTRFVHEGALLHVVPEAMDPDGNEADLTFAVAAAQPEGVTIDPSTGSLAWRPGPGTTGLTNELIFSVTDAGTPALTASAAMNAVVVAPVTLQVVPGSNGVVDLVWNGAPGVLYEIEAAAEVTGTWQRAAGPVDTAGFECSVAGLPMDGTQRFFRVRVLE